MKYTIALEPIGAPAVTSVERAVYSLAAPVFFKLTNMAIKYWINGLVIRVYKVNYINLSLFL